MMWCGSAATVRRRQAARERGGRCLRRARFPARQPIVVRARLGVDDRRREARAASASAAHARLDPLTGRGQAAPSAVVITIQPSPSLRGRRNGPDRCAPVPARSGRRASPRRAPLQIPARGHAMRSGPCARHGPPVDGRAAELVAAAPAAAPLGTERPLDRRRSSAQAADNEQASLLHYAAVWNAAAYGLSRTATRRPRAPRVRSTMT